MRFTCVWWDGMDPRLTCRLKRFTVVTVEDARRVLNLKVDILSRAQLDS